MSTRFTINSLQFAGALALAAFGIFAATPGCAVDATPPDAEEAEPIVAEDSSDMASESAEIGGPEAASTDKEPDDSGHLGKKCWATCTVQSYGGAVCPATTSGYGNTTFLGGCSKACNKAK